MILVWILGQSVGPCSFNRKQGILRSMKKDEQARVHPKFIVCFCIKRKQKIHKVGGKCLHCILCFSMLYPLS